MKSIIQVLARDVRDHEYIRLLADGQAEGEAIGVLTTVFRRGLRL